MDPQQQPYQAPPGGNNPYDFILNPNQPQKKPLVPKIGGGNSFVGKIALIVGGAVILIIVMWIVGNLLGGGGVNTAELTKLVQQQEEITRVATEGATSARTDIRNASANTKLSITSQQQAWLAFLADHGTKIDEERQALLQNATTDQALAKARTNNTFDATYLDIMRSYLTDYSAALQAEFNRTSNQAERSLLSKHFDQTQLLLKQLPAR